MVSAKDMQQVLQIAEVAQSRVVLVGDVQQLKAVEAGRPFAQLLDAGITSIEMGEIQRQTDANLRHAVELASQGLAGRSLAILNQKVHEIDSDGERQARIAKDYTALPKRERDQTLIVAGTHAARSAINENVRAELGLAGKGISVTTLIRQDFTQAQSRMSLSYQVGDIVEPKKNYNSLGIKRGDMARVISTEAGCVTLERHDGQLVRWCPALQPNVTSYREAMRELSIDDLVRFTANNHECGIVNSERATVLNFDAERHEITFQMSDSRCITLDTSKPLHLDHGYCSTVHAAQGQTAERVLIEADTKSTTSNESTYYVAISRARSEVCIYTDDKSLLPDAMSRVDTKHAALDLHCEITDLDMTL